MRSLMGGDVWSGGRIVVGRERIVRGVRLRWLDGLLQLGTGTCAT